MRSPDEEQQVLACWHLNASAWTDAVRSGAIDSRRLVTDAAIIDAVCERSPRSVLDLGCGEGWLARRLAERGIRVVGLDAEPRLIEAARRAGGACFEVGSYRQLLDEPRVAALRELDVLVCNFSLFGQDSVSELFSSVRRLLKPEGAFIVQTLHPWVACGEEPYRDGWRAGSWAGFSEQFSDPAPWYFRTLESWFGLFSGAGLLLREIREPLHPVSGRPVSAIFVATAQS